MDNFTQVVSEAVHLQRKVIGEIYSFLKVAKIIAEQCLSGRCHIHNNKRVRAKTVRKTYLLGLQDKLKYAKMLPIAKCILVYPVNLYKLYKTTKQKPIGDYSNSPEGLNPNDNSKHAKTYYLVGRR